MEPRTYLIEGWLYKLSASCIHRPWRKKYFALSETELVYSKYKDDQETMNVIDLRYYSSVTRYRAKSSAFAFRLESNCKCRKAYTLYAEIHAEGQRWFNLLESRVTAVHADHQCGLATKTNMNEAADDIGLMDHDALKGEFNSSTHKGDNGRNVLDKWLAHLDLSETSSSATTKGLSNEASDLNVYHLSGFQSNDSLESAESTIRSFSTTSSAFTPASSPVTTGGKYSIPPFLMPTKSTSSNLRSTIVKSTKSTNSTHSANSVTCANGANSNNTTAVIRMRSPSLDKQSYHAALRSPTLTPSSSLTTRSVHPSDTADDVFNFEQDAYVFSLLPPPRGTDDRQGLPSEIGLPPRRPPPRSPLPPTPTSMPLSTPNAKSITQ